jgi:hypothetical protein
MTLSAAKVPTENEQRQAGILPYTRIPIPAVLKAELLDFQREINNAIACHDADDLINALLSLRQALLIICTEVYR